MTRMLQACWEGTDAGRLTISTCMGAWIFRWAPFRRQLGRWVDMFADRGILLIFFITGRGHSCFQLRIHRRWQPPASLRLTFWNGNRNGWRNFGKTLAPGKKSWDCWGSTLAE